MNLREYFETKKGFGVLSTADREGRVDAAVYSRPHFMEDGSIAFIMRDRLTHKNIRENPHALYLFREDGPGYQGRRLFLTRIREEENADLIGKLRRRSSPDSESQQEMRFLVYFTIDQQLPLIGTGDKS